MSISVLGMFSAPLLFKNSGIGLRPSVKEWCRRFSLRLPFRNQGSGLCPFVCSNLEIFHALALRNSRHWTLSVCLEKLGHFTCPCRLKIKASDSTPLSGITEKSFACPRPLESKASDSPFCIGLIKKHFPCSCPIEIKASDSASL